MKTSQPYYRVVATLPEQSCNHRFAKLVAIRDDRIGRYFTANTCDVHVRRAPWDGGEPSQYTHDEILERLDMLLGRAGEP